MKDLVRSTHLVLTQNLARAIIALDHERSSMIPGADPAKFKGGVHTEVIRTKPQKESGKQKYLSKKMGGDCSPFKPFKGTTLSSILLGFYPCALYV